MSNKKSTLYNLDDCLKRLDHQKPHICRLRFPNYRSLSPNSELPFDFPITILLGCNGTNKSSILHALYGSPLKQTIADFWFETELDAIPLERDGLKQSVTHEYYNEDGQLVECIKARAPRGTLDPDYWEAVKHSQPYGFSTSGTRIPPVKLKVVHLDFRGELPAFDKYFYFPDPKHLAKRVRCAKETGRLRREYRKQDYLRQRSRALKKLIEASGHELSNDELEALQYVLERNYISGRVLNHSQYHGHNGYTILFKTQHVSGYSDAFAGSGESAATLLIHKIFNAPPNSLVLLDEPETSLHPRAQQRMLEFIAYQAARKQLQVVIATHSIHLAHRLPQKAVRVLTLEEDGLIRIRTDLSADEALHEIGSLPPGKTIFVEDERAKHIVVEALKLDSVHPAKEFQVIVREGGASRIYRDILAFSKSQRNDVFVIFDGDNRPKKDIPHDNQLPQGKKELESLIAELTAGNDEKGPKLDFVNPQEANSYIRFLRKAVFYLPQLTPEEFVWDTAEAELLLGKKLPQKINNEKDYKQRILLLAKEIPGLDEESVYQLLFSRLLSQQSVKKEELMKVINYIRQAA